MYPRIHTITGVSVLLKSSSVGVVLAVAACHAPAVDAMATHDHASVISLAAHPEASYDDDPPLTRQQRTDIQWLRSILENPNSEHGIRSGAAVRLLNMNLPQATSVLADSLRSGDAAIALAVVEAMHQAGEPVEGLLDAAVAELKRATGPLLDQLSVALSRYGEVALTPIASLASDLNAPVSERLGPIHALGAFRSKSAAVELMAILTRTPAEPAEIVQAVCSALQRGTGLPYGQDADAWREWWAHAKDQPREQWMSQIIRRLAEQLAEADLQIQRERELARQTEQRLAELYRSHFTSVASVEEQLAMLPPLLEDPLPSVRSFALDRIARLLRDSVRISEEMQLKIAQRLDDQDPSLRIAALRLLDQLNHDQTSAKVANRLKQESNPEVITAIMDVLNRRPSREAVDAVQQWLSDAQFGQRAANVIWEALLVGHELPAEHIDSMRQTLRSMLESELPPAHVRLLARLGDEQDIARLEPLLDGDDETIQRRVADGFFRRGHRQPLLDRAEDAVVYPFAVRVIASGAMDLAAFRTLVLMTPMEQHRVMWHAAVEQSIAKLAADQLLAADDLLASAQATDVQLREALLRRGASLPADAIIAEHRDRIVMRLSRLLLDLNRPAEAHELLVSMNGHADTAGARLVRFEAAVLVGEYDLAEQLVPEPGTWIALLSRVQSNDVETAMALHDEIVRRFGDVLDPQHTTELEAVLQRLQSNLVEEQSPA